MTIRQVEKLADTANQIGTAALLGGIGDAALSGARLTLDLTGAVVGLGLLWFSLYLLGLLGDNGTKP